MNINSLVLGNDERAIYSLRELYEQYGYSRFKMSKFEEYDLYVRNKDFLVSDNIITFTDTNGKLMALKPDVTLSIIKNSQENSSALSKVYYNENVYRVSKGSRSFKEIMQIGLECIGEADDFCIFEVLTLAAKSLECISENYVLDISHLGIIEDILNGLNLSQNERGAVLKCISEKNLSELSSILPQGEALLKLVKAYGGLSKVLPVLNEIYGGELSPCAKQLTELVSALEESGFKNKIRIDFSVINDMSYYNGVVFRGFIDGIPTGILSGGQYDKLMAKMNRKSNAIGFAVYLDALDRLSEDWREFDVDTVILYDERASLESIKNAAELIRAGGKSAAAYRNIPSGLKFRQALYLSEKGALTIEKNA